MVNRFWRAVLMGFSGIVNITFTHACTIKYFSSDSVFKSSLRHLSRPGALPGVQTVFNVLCDFLTGECATQPALLAVLYVSVLSFVIRSSAAIIPLLCQKSVKCQHFTYTYI